MIIRPAIDLREGSCVQLVGGDYENELFRFPDPIGVAKSWIDKGFNNLHVIDLDRATGKGDNKKIIQKICSELEDINIQIGGGLRNDESIDEMFKFGANQVVVGTKAILDPEWFRKIASKYKNKIYIALEVDETTIKISGWQEDAGISLEQSLSMFESFDLAGIFVTAIHVEGRCEGIDKELFEKIRKLTDMKIIASGGVTNIDDIKTLERINIQEVVIGTAIYTDPKLSLQIKENQEWFK